MNDRDDEIRALLDAQERAWLAGDANAFADAAMPEIVFTNVVGLFSVGRAGFIGQHRVIFATFYAGSRFAQRIEHIAFVRPDVAIVDTLTTVTGFGALPPAIVAHEGAVTTRLEQVLALGGDGWRVAAFHNVLVHPAAGAAAPGARV
jgi:uncharacterized protein (TIGR02246 family)